MHAINQYLTITINGQLNNGFISDALIICNYRAAVHHVIMSVQAQFRGLCIQLWPDSIDFTILSPYNCVQIY